MIFGHIYFVNGILFFNYCAYIKHFLMKLYESIVYFRYYSIYCTCSKQPDNLLLPAFLQEKKEKERNNPMNPKALFQLSYGLYVVSTKHDKKMNGCIINTVTQVTDDPKQIVLAINKKNLTCDLIQKSGIFSVSILSETAPFTLFQRFGFQSGSNTDKFVDVPFSMTAQELPYLTEHTTAYLDCKVVNSYDLGTHMLFLASVSDGEILSGEKAMTYSFYHEYVKPKPENTSVKGWRCVVCGYVYEGEELPPDFICPWCKHGVEDFEKII